MVTSIQAFLAGQGQYVGRVDAETGEVQRVPRIQKRVKVARDGDREGELGRVMDDAEDMRVDLENALNEFLGSGSIDALQVTTSSCMQPPAACLDNAVWCSGQKPCLQKTNMWCSIWMRNLRTRTKP